MGKKISQLTAITRGAFADADLFEIAVSSGGAFVSRKITGAEIKATIPSGITINSTPITSGTSGGVLFENTGVVKESGNFYWDDTNARLSIGQGSSPGAVLDVRAAGTASTDIAWRVRNTANSDNLAYVSGNGLAVIGINASSSPTLIIDPSGSARATLRGGTNQSILLNSSGWNNLNGGSGGWDIEATGGQIRQRNGSNYTLLSGNFFGIGRTPAARLDVQAQGALSTDIAFRVRNSADTQNFLEIQGNGKYRLGDEVGGLSNAFSYVSDGRLFMAKSGGNFIELNNSGQNRVYNPAGGWEITGNTTLATQAVSGSSGSGTFYWFAGTLQVGGLVATGGASNSFWISNGVAPTTNYSDRHWYYSADIVAGNAAPHFRTEAGDIIKLYKETTAVTAATVVNGTGSNVKDDDTFDGYTVAKVVKALRNLGILA